VVARRPEETRFTTKAGVARPKRRGPSMSLSKKKPSSMIDLIQHYEGKGPTPESPLMKKSASDPVLRGRIAELRQLDYQRTHLAQISPSPAPIPLPRQHPQFQQHIAQQPDVATWANQPGKGRMPRRPSQSSSDGPAPMARGSDAFLDLAVVQKHGRSTAEMDPEVAANLSWMERLMSIRKQAQGTYKMWLEGLKTRSQQEQGSPTGHGPGEGGAGHQPRTPTNQHEAAQQNRRTAHFLPVLGKQLQQSSRKRDNAQAGSSPSSSPLPPAQAVPASSLPSPPSALKSKDKVWVPEESVPPIVPVPKHEAKTTKGFSHSLGTIAEHGEGGSRIHSSSTTKRLSQETIETDRQLRRDLASDMDLEFVSLAAQRPSVAALINSSSTAPLSTKAKREILLGVVELSSALDRASSSPRPPARHTRKRQQRCSTMMLSP
jgi:hypothetical protein